MPILTEVLAGTKSSPHNAVRWSPAEADYNPVCGVLQIQTKRACDEYLVTEFPCGFPGRGFRLDKVTEGKPAAESGYGVFVSRDGPAADSCDCPGSCYGAACCKHRSAIRALLANGWL